MSATILRMAVPGPMRSLFDYLPPIQIDPKQLRPGMRLEVPFGHSTRCAWLVALSQQTEIDPKRLKPALKLLDQEPLLDAQDQQFLAWAADYYQYPLGNAILTALPVALRKGRDPITPEQTGWQLTPAGNQAIADQRLRRRAPKQYAVLTLLKNAPQQQLTREQLQASCQVSTPFLRTLETKGWVKSCTISTAITSVLQSGPDLNQAQAEAVKTIACQTNVFHCFLLDGVTGSGKTEVYLHLIEHMLAAKRQTLVLVPEIALTPQLLHRFQRRLPCPIGALHSGLAARERERIWLLAANGHLGVVLGTRSAVFTPMPNLGLIVVDEEHDLSFKQQDSFRYSARDLAVVRARQRNCPIVLGSATPSLETLHNVQLDRYQHLILPQRAGKATPPGWHLIDIRSVPLEAGISPQLYQLMTQHLSAGEQILLFLNRRGYAPVLTCHQCGWISECPHCDARLTVHKTSARLWCHHCGYQRLTWSQCPKCGSQDLRLLGQGTQRIEEVLEQRFANYQIARIDRDSIRRKGALEQLLTAIRQNEYQLLLGTQMLAKGHDFPNVTLVGILDVDYGLFGADYRSSERMAQLIIQVAGRAGRAHKAGQVVLQTRHPSHPLLQTLVQQGYGAFAAQALAERQMAQLPPFFFQVLLRAESEQTQAAFDLLEQGLQLAKPLADPAVEFWGPIPAPMERRAGQVRAHLLLQAPQRHLLQRLLTTWLPQLQALPKARKVHWSVDVDPQELL